MSWLLDTCVVSELFRKRPEPAVVSWLEAHRGQCALSLVSVGEIQYGIERLPHGRNRNALQHWFDGVCTQFSARTLGLDEVVWRNFGRLKASLEVIGKKQDDMDLLLAASAHVHRLILVTRNVRHFADTGITLLNPWD